MKTKHLLSLILLACIVATTLAQERATMKVPYRQLIISEYRTGPNQDSYMELTNVGDSIVNLSEFYLVNRDERNKVLQPIIRDAEGNITNIYYTPGTGLITEAFYTRLPDFDLHPKESYVISNVFDGLDASGKLIQKEQLVNVTDMFVHRPESSIDTTIAISYYPEYHNYDFDSVSVYYDLLRQGANACNTRVLSHRIYNEEGIVIDSVAVDGIRLIFTDGGGGTWEEQEIAGVDQALQTHIIVRKNSITQGNLNWDLSRGVSEEDSEWFLVPKYAGRMVYTTVGVHGDFDISVTSDALNINLAQNKIVVPWGTERFDSLVNQIKLGPGMAWLYTQDVGTFEGMGFITCQNGDILTLYATGDELKKVDLAIEVDISANNDVRVFPKRTISYPDGVPTWGTETYYYTTRSASIMDTIGNVAYGTRVDTLFTRIEKIPGAEWEIIWLNDDKTRVDLTKGDILRVTAKNGLDTKDYFIDVLPFNGSSNANLNAITWPDKPGYIDGWRQDTIPDFSPTQRNYKVKIPYGASGVPALQVNPVNPNARIKMTPALNLTGTIAERTTTIEVISEDQTITSTYIVTFDLDKPSFLIQPYIAEPFFSQIHGGTQSFNSYVEIYNPGTEPIDMSSYFFGVNINSTWTPVTFLNNVVNQISNNNWNLRYGRRTGFTPGFKWPASKEEWDLKPGTMIFDPATDPLLEPGKVFVIGNGYWVDDPKKDQIDVILGRGNRWGEADLEVDPAARSMVNFLRGTADIYLFKILNDSIQQGFKPIGDPADFELIEYFGGKTAPWPIAGIDIGNTTAFSVIRKPHVYTPGTEQFRGWGTSAEDSDWIVLRSGDVYENMTLNTTNLNFDIGTHSINEITTYKSTILSAVYLVDNGYIGNLSIHGVGGGENVEVFLNNIIKIDPNQDLKVYSSTGENPKELTELVVTDDRLVVISADGENTTTYTINATALDNQVELTANAGSGLIITANGQTGSITGFPMGISIADILSQVNKPATASLSIINEKGELVPLQYMNTDTVKVFKTVLPGVAFKVIAQNKTDFRVYSLQPNPNPTDAYVISDLYKVLQDSSAVTSIPFGTSVSGLLSNLYAASGGSIVIYDKAGNVRDLGLLNYDDHLVVTSQDGSNFKVYYLQFITEPEGLNPLLRAIPEGVSNLRMESLSTDRTEATITWNYTSKFEQGFVILRDGAEIARVYGEFLFKDAGLTPQTTYTYTVYAFNELGNSENQILELTTTHVGVDKSGTNAPEVFPTITSDMIYLRNIADNNRVQLMDALGRTLMDKKFRELHGVISMLDYADGIYLIKISDHASEVKTIRIVKKQ